MIKITKVRAVARVGTRLAVAWLLFLRFNYHFFLFAVRSAFTKFEWCKKCTVNMCTVNMCAVNMCAAAKASLY